MATGRTFDTVVVGAGVFGSWTAWHLARQRKQRVLLVDAYGAAHSRASSGGESRIIRMGYGADEIYTRWSQQSLVQWKELFAATGEPLFLQTGVLWLAGANDAQLNASKRTLQRCDVKFEVLNRGALEKRYPQVNMDGITEAVLEPESGVLLARRAVARVVRDSVKHGVEMEITQVTTPSGYRKRVEQIETSSGERISAGQFVFACGAWLGKIFPEVLGSRIFPTRQEVFFFGCPAGDTRFAAPQLPTWLFQGDLVYGMPDIESRGLKFARDAHGEHVDPDTQSRVPSTEGAAWAREYVARRFPALKNAPITETRVCQYENTSNGDFLIDRHPEFENVWLAGGGSGHGFKHGPAFGEYLAAQICGEGKPEPRFSLETKATQQKRAVY
ncbi:MAG TPA: FAD-dependent oxidoreductase [Candidatus Acidoferrum sp.]